MNCYMCGSPATRRMTPDLDISGIPLCAEEHCYAGLVVVFWANPTGDDARLNKVLLRERKKLHKEAGNKFRP
jgi:hypothetical protein